MIRKLEEEKIRIFQLNDQLAEFEELVVEDDIFLYELLDSDFILLFVDPEHYRVWIWHGANTTTRMKFIAAKIAPKIRDLYGIAYKITAVDEGQEITGFKIFSGLASPPSAKRKVRGKKDWNDYKGLELSLMEYITYKGKKFRVKDRKLVLSNLGIRNINDIIGLEELTKLKELDLSQNQISEIKGLEKLENLEELVLYENKISEIKGLEDLENLTVLSLMANQIPEIKGLENLKNLIELDLSLNQIPEIKCLETLRNLQKLGLLGNRISEIKGLENLNNLRLLHLGCNQISEIKGLKNLKNLQYLELIDNQISEIKGLENLKNLIELDLKRNPIPENLLIRLGAFYNDLGLLTIPDPQKFIDYCRPMQEAIQKIKKMLKVSTRIRLDMMKETLRMDVDTFNDIIFDWAEKFGFTIDGDYVVINKDSVSDFIDSLDKQFIKWEKIEKDKISKV